MPIQWSTKTDEESKEVILPAGTYEFEVMKSEVCISSKGNNYLKLTIRLLSKEGICIVIDNIVDMPSMFYKRKAFWESVGKPNLVNTEDEKDYLHEKGKAIFKTESFYSQKHDKNFDRLIIEKYIKKETLEDDFSIEDKDIPF